MWKLEKFRAMILQGLLLLLAITIVEIQSLKVMELMAPYKIQNIATGKYLTTHEQGYEDYKKIPNIRSFKISRDFERILGLRTGMVVTAPYEGREATHQQWTLAWDPTMDDRYDGYRIESSQEYLNFVTAYYPDGKTRAIANVWEIIELPGNVRIFKNKRTQKCLTVSRTRIDVVERTCSYKNRYQHWKLERLDLDKRIRSSFDPEDDYDDHF